MAGIDEGRGIAAFLANVWGGGGAARGGETSKLANRDRGPRVPKRS
jgi:hypothetical protein